MSWNDVNQMSGIIFAILTLVVCVGGSIILKHDKQAQTNP